MTSPDRVEIVEVALRDGLQNEPVIVSTEDKIALARRLVAAGARRIEAVSFAHPRVAPAMADAEAVMDNVSSYDRTTFMVTVTGRFPDRLAAEMPLRSSLRVDRSNNTPVGEEVAPAPQ